MKIKQTNNRTAAANNTYKKLEVQWLNEVLCFVSSLTRPKKTLQFHSNESHKKIFTQPNSND